MMNNEDQITAMVLSRGNCLKQYTWGDDCYGWDFVDTDALSVKQELMPPDTREQLHYHEIANQFFFILKGKAWVNIDGVEHVLKPNEGVEVKPGQKHFISNKDDVDLEFLLYSQPSTKNDRHNMK
ncbi:mannose-6-phosphate isomerase-like protein (cupin superfamily) [Mucilaginibacter gracilis]|uniref:Mannose-6-phosphate isomerase-like protein (Cupin superfamily) n=1 Tax=Mucilaginibacter gracilis TaxID=423350 RepID=A0A495J332_9SPHI|nr:cupin domain-containing protein [Mucilaginibacter gracilis]RKR82778.1 mannose-6-phosphate isomerase-like protein (cupin superfamily) [Mucilaginibacter gracilis]